MGLRPASVGGQSILVKGQQGSSSICNSACLLLIRRTLVAHACAMLQTMTLSDG